MSRKFELPKIDQRTSIIGRTGSGKTQFAAWLLSKMPFDRMPFVIFDYKRDKLIAYLDDIGAREIGIDEKVPRKPGIYIVRPLLHEVDEVENFIWSVWVQEKTGLWFDEMYMVPDKKALRAVLTQGRSKHIPTIMLSQRPVWMTRFMLSESDHYVAFKLQHPDDKKVIAGFLPKGRYPEPIGEYHSSWHNVSQDHTYTLLPAPEADEILDEFETRLKPRRKMV